VKAKRKCAEGEGKAETVREEMKFRSFASFLEHTSGTCWPQRHEREQHRRGLKAAMGGEAEEKSLGDRGG
jgi:hypothetical protein